MKLSSLLSDICADALMMICRCCWKALGAMATEVTWPLMMFVWTMEPVQVCTSLVVLIRCTDRSTHTLTCTHTHHTHKHTHACMHTHTHTHAHTHARMHSHTHIHTHTKTFFNSQRPKYPFSREKIFKLCVETYLSPNTTASITAKKGSTNMLPSLSFREPVEFWG